MATTKKLPNACSKEELENARDKLMYTESLIRDLQKKSTLILDDLEKHLTHFTSAYIQTWELMTGKALKFDYAAEWIVGNAYFSSFSQLESKRKQKNFYVAQVVSLIEVLNDYRFKIEGIRKDDNLEKRANRLCRLIAGVCTSGIFMLENYAEKASLSFRQRITMSTLDHRLHIFFAANNLWVDLPPGHFWVSAPILRTGIELRIRACVDIYGISIEGKDEPLAVTHLIEALRKEKEAISVVPWSSIQKIYQWANIYTHSAFKEYPWLIRYALIVLHPFWAGRRKEDGFWSSDNGIEISEEGIARIITSLHETAKSMTKNPNVKLLSFGHRMAIALREAE